MLTKDQALNAREFHYGDCTRTIGPRGGVTEHSEVWRRSGMTKTWKTRPDEFRIPAKYGLYRSAYIEHWNAHEFHAAEDCPLHNPAYVTHDERFTDEFVGDGPSDSAARECANDARDIRESRR